MNQAHLRLAGGGVISTLRHVRGEAGIGTFRLEVGLDWAPVDWDTLTNARVFFGGELHVGFGNGMRHPLSQLQAVYGLAFSDAERSTHAAPAELSTNLLPAQLEALERERGGGPLSLRLKLRGILVPGLGSTLHTAEGFGDDVEYTLKPAEWVEVLEGWNYAKGFLMQVPVLGGESSLRATRARKDLEKAATEMAEGRYREAIATCRDALELAYGSGDKNAHPELGFSVRNLQEASKEARFWLARRGLWAIAHAAKHRDDAAAEVEWNRRDAQAVILILGALLEQDPPTS